MKTTDWHALSIPDLARRLETTLAGLTSGEAAHRLREIGPNVVEHRGPPSALRLVLSQFRSPLIAILFVAAFISFLVRERTDAWVIFGVVVFNAGIGFLQERRASKAMEELRSLTPHAVHVLRDGVERLIPSADLVPGDLVLLEAGAVLPADGRLVEAVNLKVSEAVFTGESVPVEKRSDPLPADTPAGNRHNLAWRGTTVVAGRGELLVTETGMRTRFGEIVRIVGGARKEVSPFQRGVNAFARRLTGIILALAAIVFVIGLMQRFPLNQIFLLSVSLVVSLIPEGLPVVITLTLAWGMWRMARRKALIRRLSAVETLGSVTTIAADKTGTLTFGQMMVEELTAGRWQVTVSGQGYDRQGDFFLKGKPVDPLVNPEVGLALKVGALCNDARFSPAEGGEQPIGDPTELALLVAAEKAGLKQSALAETLPRVGEFPFDFHLRYMVTFHRTADGGQFVAVKGAPRQILELCDEQSVNGAIVPLTAEDKAGVRERFEAMARRGLRGLALAYALTRDDRRLLRAPDLKRRLVYLGLAGLRDPIRTEAAETIRLAQGAGIRVLMLTGDYRVTAETVGREIGLTSGRSGEALDGSELAQLADPALAERLPKLTVVSRVSPEEKFRIARLMKQRGQVVAMTGDGINDVPALSEADIGIAIGAAATDAAKEASEMVVTDGDLSSIVAAVAEGRTIFRNIQRVLFFLLASNFSELVLILIAILAGLPLPLLPTQIIWLNAITDPFLGIALAREPSKPSILRERPRPVQQPIIERDHWFRIGLLALTIGVSTFALFLTEQWRQPDRNHVLAMTLTSIALAEWLSAFTFRSSRLSIFTRQAVNPLLAPAFLTVLALQLAILYLPRLNELFHVAPLSLTDWFLAVVFAVPVLIVDEIRKVFFRRRLARTHL